MPPTSLIVEHLNSLVRYGPVQPGQAGIGRADRVGQVWLVEQANGTGGRDDAVDYVYGCAILAHSILFNQ